MRGKSAEMLRLIKSLSTSEKKAFRKASTATGGKEYVALFNAYDLDKNITEKQLELQFGKHKLPPLKNYLYQNLLKWLVDQDGLNGGAPDVYKLARMIRVLEARGITEGSVKLLKQHIVQYRERHLYMEVLILIRLKLRLLSLSALGTSSKEVQKLLAEEEALLLSMIKQNKAEQSMNQIRESLSYRTPALRKKLLSELKTIDKLPGYGQTQYLQFYTAYIQKDAVKVKNVLLDLLKMLCDYRVRDPLALKSFFEIYLMALQLLKSESELPFLRQLLNRVPVNEHTLEYKRSLTALVDVYFYRSDASRKLPKVPDVTFTDPLLNLLCAESLYYSSLAYREMGDFENAMKLQIRIINNPAFAAFTELQVYTRIVNLISNFDAEHYSIVGYLHQQTLFYINRCGKLFDFEIQFMNNMRLVRKFRNTEEKVAFYTTVLNRMEALRAAGSEPLAYRFDFSKWLHKKMNESL